jgi:hypothetical protein
MPTLTLETLRQNPWNVLTHDLPSDASELLLRTAQIAATCCRQIEFEALERASEHTSADRCSRAHRKIGEIIGLLEDNFGVAAHEIMLSRNST